jgi:hypothetical protein
VATDAAVAVASVEAVVVNAVVIAVVIAVVVAVVVNAVNVLNVLSAPLLLNDCFDLQI